MGSRKVRDSSAVLDEFRCSHHPPESATGSDLNLHSLIWWEILAEITQNANSATSPTSSQRLRQRSHIALYMLVSLVQPSPGWAYSAPRSPCRSITGPGQHANSLVGRGTRLPAPLSNWARAIKPATLSGGVTTAPRR
jgi:hypothetical protein